ncbi:hypothetical protein AIT14_000900 [Salmonella enterica subsp. arizonae serovar 41:z4,z23:- str. 01-0089]|nr:hypothetical protein [Salmonella enterica subsp. arizonae serovar 41:z4,z23:- str. 01-0089]QVP41639.1 hypothetical protein AIT14_000900 [Salmonella enterica subsp. arizonae serovar 41:z4,z23:- str. 01-0089]
MHSTFTAHGYAVNKRGLTVGIRHELQATSHEEALTAVQHEMQSRGYTTSASLACTCHLLRLRG